jgi:RNA polymerase sigma factor (sigma-70 family)
MKTGRQDDIKLVERCISQDKKAWDAFVKKYNRLISHSIVQTLTRYFFPLENQIVEDLFHSVFLSLIEDNCKKLRQFRWRCSLSSWLHVIAARVTIDYLRKQSTGLSLNGETDDEIPLKDKLTNGNPLPDEMLEHKEEKVIFEQIKKGLTKRELIFLELYYSRELSPIEISRILNTTENNVYQLKNLVRKKMKKVVGKYL